MKNILEKLKDRYNIFLIAITVIFTIMGFKLAEITIIDGEYYRLNADTKRVKKLPITAPRGEIRDRKGRLLAGNTPSFTVQIMKDDLIENERNKTSLKIMSLLEKEGESYVNEFPIKLNYIDYKDNQSFMDSNIDVEKKISELLSQNNLTDDLLDGYYQHSTIQNDYKFSVAKKALFLLKENNESLPIDIIYTSEGIEYKYSNGADISTWKSENGLYEGNNPKNDLINLLSRDDRNIIKLLNHPIVRKIAYDLLDNRGLANEFRIRDFVYSYDIELKKLKKNLSTIYPYITLETSAKEDFINILKNDFDEFMNAEFSTDDESKIIIGKKVIDYLKEKNANIPIEYSSEEKSKFRFKSEDAKNEFINDNQLSKDTDARKALIMYLNNTYISEENIIQKDKMSQSTSIEKTLLGDFITSDEIKAYSQKFILNTINPKISIAKWEYVPMINKESWMGRYNVKEPLKAQEMFEKLEKKYEINEEIKDNSQKISKYESRFILLLIDLLGKQGYKAYEPINIAYGVKDVTVAKIKENSMDLPGVKVTIEPMRYYPMNKLAAHSLGYLGKISQSSEIQRYIDNLGYSRNDIIGKTGIEKEFEEYLNGDDGYRTVEVDAFGNTYKVLEEKKAVPGKTVFLTIDSELQKVAENYLKHALEEIQVAGEYESKWGNYNYKLENGRPLRNATSGSTVAIDVKTGEVLAIANYPSYDPNLFSTGISSEDYESLKPEYENDPLAPRPLFNIALRTTIQPGSTFKMITSLAALENGMDPYQKINSLGYVMLGSQRFGCWIWNSYHGTHGPTNMMEAIRDSCNYYFYTVTAGQNLRTNRNIGSKVDIEDMLDMARQFGLDEKTGIEIPEEKSGRVPNEEDRLALANRTLRNILRSNRENIIEGENVDNEKIESLIGVISNWANKENKMSSSEVSRNLEELGINPDKKHQTVYGDLSLKDYIKYTYFRQATFQQANAFNIAIGQGENSYTPIQMANYIATLSNGGYRNEVTIIDEIKTYNNKDINYQNKKKSKRIDLKDYKYLDYVKKGMHMVTMEGGTASSVFRNFPIEVGAKTGTAEKDGISPVTGTEYDNYAWFVAFAPYDDPQIAVATVIFQGGHGGYAAPVSRDIIAEYLGLNNENEEINFKNKLIR